MKFSSILKKYSNVKLSALLKKAYDERTYLHVPYNDKELAKSHGARWDMDMRQWYVRGEVPEELQEFLNPTKTAPIDEKDRVYLFVKFKDKDLVKRHGARWDADKKQWYVEKDKVPDELQKFTTKQKIKQMPKGDPNGKFRLCWWESKLHGRKFQVCQTYATKAEMERAYDIASEHSSKSSLSTSEWHPQPTDDNGNPLYKGDVGGYFDHWSGTWKYYANY
jgi:hypothetical protein